jgi:hypothetical protein
MITSGRNFFSAGGTGRRIVDCEDPFVAQPDEIATLRRTYDEQLANFRSDPKAAEGLLAVGELKLAASIDKADLAAMTAVANVLLNLNETITK